MFDTRKSLIDTAGVTLLRPTDVYTYIVYEVGAAGVWELRVTRAPARVTWNPCVCAHICGKTLEPRAEATTSRIRLSSPSQLQPHSYGVAWGRKMDVCNGVTAADTTVSSLNRRLQRLKLCAPSVCTF